MNKIFSNLWPDRFEYASATSRDPFAQTYLPRTSRHHPDDKTLKDIRTWGFKKDDFARMYCFVLNNLELLVIPEPIKGQKASFESLYENWG